MMNCVDEITPFHFKTDPFEHQLTILKESWEREYYAILWEMGTGKSKLLLDTASALFKAGKINGLLIIAPKGVYLNWVYEEIPKHLAAEHYCAFYSASSKKRDRERAENCCQQYDEDLDVLCMNVEAFSGKKGKEFAARFILNHKVLLCIDESTTIKTPKAARTKTIRTLAKRCPYRRIMTGSPITQSPLDLYSQTQLLKPGVLGHESFFSFKHYYAEIIQMRMGTRQFPKINGFRNLDELKKRLIPFSSRLTKEDCMDLPPKIYSTRYVELTGEQRRLYDDMKNTCVIELQDQVITVTSILNAISKVHQIICGHVKNEEGETLDVESNRTKAMIEITEDMDRDGKAIIWCAFRRDVELVIKALTGEYGSQSVVHYYGSTKDDDRPENVRRFQEDPNVKFLVGTAQTGGKGITLTAANTVIYYSNTFNLEHRLQTEDRAHRHGQEKKVNYIDLIVKDTIDEKIVRALKAKKTLADLVLTGWEEIFSS